MSMGILISLAILLIIGSLITFFSLSDDADARRSVFESIALKKKGRIAREKCLKLIVPYEGGEMALFYEKRWIKNGGSGRHRHNTLDKVSVVSFQLNGRMDKQFQITVKDPLTSVAYGLLDGMLEGMSARTGIQLPRANDLEQFIVLSMEPVFARDFLSTDVQQCLLEIKNFRPVVNFGKGQFELLVHKKIQEEREWEDLLGRGQRLIGRLLDLLGNPRSQNPGSNPGSI